MVLERDVIIHVLKPTRWAGCLTLRLCWPLWALCGLALWRLALLWCIVAATQQLQFGSDDFYRVFLDACLVGVLAVLEAAFNVHGLALAHVFTGNLCKAFIEGDAVPFGGFGDFARFAVLAAGAGGHGYVADCFAIWQVARFWVTAHVPNELDFIYGCHGVLLVNLGDQAFGLGVAGVIQRHMAKVGKGFFQQRAA